MAQTVELTVSEILEALRVAGEPAQDPEGYFTVTELSQAAGIADRTLRTWLLQLKKAGRLSVSQVRREQLSGTFKNVPAYRLREKAV